MQQIGRYGVYVMPFSGIADSAQRAALIAYLKTI